MATKTIAEVFGEYRSYLLGLKPSANVDQTDSDWWIRGRVLSGVVSGIYADIEKNAQDAFPQNARREALLRWKVALFDESTFTPATVASGDVLLTGTGSSTWTGGLQATHEPSGNVYTFTDGGALSGGVGEGTIQSILAGETQNLEPGTELTIGSPPSGIDSTITVGADGVKGGTNEENETRAATRILLRLRSSARGGNDADYQVWALSIAGVTSASVLRYANGLGTVGIIITSGTVDVDAALDADQVISFEASDELIDATEEYIASVCPNTACPFVYGAQEIEVDVTVQVRFVTGTIDTIPSGQTLTQGEIVEREVKRAIYHVPLGGDKFEGQGYVMAKAIQDMVDVRLSATSEVLGTTFQIVIDRSIVIDSADDNDTINMLVGANQRPVPGTISVVDWAVD